MSLNHIWCGLKLAQPNYLEEKYIFQWLRNILIVEGKVEFL